MPNDMRDRLIELLDIIIQPGEKTLGDIADHFIANGVILPPCKVGDKVYIISETRAKEAEIETMQIESQKNAIFVKFECDDDCEGCPFEAWSQSYCGEWDCDNQYGFAQIKADDFGKTVFPTEEDAEKALFDREFDKCL